MDMEKKLILLHFLSFAGLCISEEPSVPLIVNKPNVTFEAKVNGNIGLESGSYGNISFLPGTGGSVYFDGEDLIQLIAAIISLPPVWVEHSAFGYLGTFHGGQQINVHLEAKDPEGGAIDYRKVAGDFPPGININSKTGEVRGLIPDTDTTFIFTIRATDIHGKFADSVFKIVVNEGDSCTNTTCQHEGVCHDINDDFQCDCVHPFGGKQCELNCTGNSLGVQDPGMISEAQMTAYRTYNGYAASNGRLNNAYGWIGMGNGSYLQIDFKNKTMLHSVIMQYVNTSYYTESYLITYSLDGNHFDTVSDLRGDVWKGNGGNNIYKTDLVQPVEGRFFRVYPLIWKAASNPGMRIEMFGCYVL